MIAITPVFVAMPSIALFCLLPIFGGADRLDHSIPLVQCVLMRFDGS
jgi:hypothetical protein